MEAGKPTERYAPFRCRGEICRTDSIELIGEEPLQIRVEGSPYSVVMRTPGDELFHAAGFCLGEGIADSPDDFLSIGYCRDLDPNVIEVRLRPQRVEKIGDILARRSFVSQTSCGICGKELVEDLYQKLAPAPDGFSIEIDRIYGCITGLFDHQHYYPRTKGSHAALLLDEALETVSFAEDVGRHNALDKAVGKAFMDRRLPDARLLVMSSRISYELVQKASRAGLSMMLSKSRPTALAVAMGQALNLTIVSAFDRSDNIVFCGEHRVLKD